MKNVLHIFFKMTEKISFLPLELPLVLKVMENDWMISQKFLIGKRQVYVKGFGRTRAEAWDDFYAEKEDATNVTV